jgi:hypothetical protein
VTAGTSVGLGWDRIAGQTSRLATAGKIANAKHGGQGMANAADCARRAEQTYDPTVRDLYRRMRDAWIAVAKRSEFLDDAVMPDSSSGEHSSHYGLLPQMPFGDRTRRG